jgi:hypothetical protein
MALNMHRSVADLTLLGLLAVMPSLVYMARLPATRVLMQARGSIPITRPHSQRRKPTALAELPPQAAAPELCNAPMVGPPFPGTPSCQNMVPGAANDPLSVPQVGAP